MRAEADLVLNLENCDVEWLGPPGSLSGHTWHHGGGARHRDKLILSLCPSSGIICAGFGEILLQEKSLGTTSLGS